MNELHDSVDCNNLKFEYVGPTKKASFYGYKDSKELFAQQKIIKLGFDDLVKRQNEFLNKLSNIKIDKKTIEQKEVVNNLENAHISREEVINFFTDYGKIVLDVAYKSKENKTKGTGIKILTPKRMLQRLPIALGQVIIQKVY